MTVPVKPINPDRVGDIDHGYRVACEAYAIAALVEERMGDQMPADMQAALMGALWGLCTREYRRATGEVQ